MLHVVGTRVSALRVKNSHGKTVGQGGGRKIGIDIYLDADDKSMALQLMQFHCEFRDCSQAHARASKHMHVSRFTCTCLATCARHVTCARVSCSRHGAGQQRRATSPSWRQIAGIQGQMQLGALQDRTNMSNQGIIAQYCVSKYCVRARESNSIDCKAGQQNPQA
eukprot:g75072.t1